MSYVIVVLTQMFGNQRKFRKTGYLTMQYTAYNTNSNYHFWIILERLQNNTQWLKEYLRI